MENEPSESRTEASTAPSQVSKRNVVATLILLFINLLNYMDRFTIVGVKDRLVLYFNMNAAESGLLSTAFITSFMIFAPLFGYLGDRYNRKMLMITGILIWICAVFASSFITEGNYLLFLFCRAVVGIGEASYCTIAPTILSDIFSGAARSRVFMVFYFAIPVGSGLGFISGSSIALMTDSWQWGVRFSPLLGIISIILMIFLLEEPVRGECEGAVQNVEKGSIINDIKYLASVKTYWLATLASVAVYFSIGTMAWYTPDFVTYAYGTIHHLKVVPAEEVAHINLMFGVITALSGMFGVAGGSLLAKWWREGKYIFKNNATMKADTYVCALSMFAALPFVFAAIFVAEYSVNWCLGLIYFGIMFMCLNWAINVDVLMYVIVANRRATALAVQTMFAHAFGDASAPYIIGAFSDAIRGSNVSLPAMFFSLQKALYLPTFMLVIAGAFFLAATFYVESDRKEAIYQMNAHDEYEGSRGDDERMLMRPSTPEAPAISAGGDVA